MTENIEKESEMMKNRDLASLVPPMNQGTTEFP